MSSRGFGNRARFDRQARSAIDNFLARAAMGDDAVSVDFGDITGDPTDNAALAAYLATFISDAVYGAGWNGDMDTAPSKNAVYDKIEAVVATILAAASAATTSAGSAANEAVTPAGLAGSRFGTAVWPLLVTDPAGAALTVGDGKAYLAIPAELDGMNLVGVKAYLIGAVSTSGIPTFQIANVTDGVDMLSTKLTIDANESSSNTAATAAVIDTAKDDVVTNDLLRIDCDVAGTGAKGVYIELRFQLP